MAEQTLYDALWREATPTDDAWREITIGYRTLAAAARVHWNTVRRNLDSLQDKLAIEIIRAENNIDQIGRTYRVYSYKAILERRRAAGFEWFVKDRAGVRLLSVAALPSEVIPPLLSQVSGTPQSTALSESTVTSRPTGPLPREGIPAVTSQGTLLGSTSRNSSEERTSSLPGPALVEAMMQATGTVDDDAVRRLAAACRQRAADASDEEIAYFLRGQAERFRRMPGIKNLVGLLITQVPRCFEGESFRQFREAERQRREAEVRQAAELRADAERILADPDAGQMDKEWARMVLND